MVPFDVILHRSIVLLVMILHAKFEVLASTVPEIGRGFQKF